ncbi:MAG: hypothetical protein PHR35_17755 [Kiritimatiellae bacterium]|nr:hypothetical protein [Kiritimatiellia bacterium]
MRLAELVREAQSKGIRDFGVTDHVHTAYSLCDIARSRAEFLSCDPPRHFHFGVEVSCMSQWEFDEIATGRHGNPVYGLREGGPAGCELAIAITPEDIRNHQIEYVVAGTHWPMYVPLERDPVIRDYHRQNMFLVRHPLVDIVAHPWWWMGHWKDDNGDFHGDPWFGDFRVIPRSMHNEFAAAAIECNTAVEINISANLLNPHYPEAFVRRYLEYLAELQSQGVRLSIGSDSHASHYDIDFERAAKLLESAGIADEFWRLEPRTGSLLTSRTQI